MNTSFCETTVSRHAMNIKYLKMLTKNKTFILIRQIRIAERNGRTDEFLPRDFSSTTLCHGRDGRHFKAARLAQVTRAAGRGYHYACWLVRPLAHHPEAQRYRLRRLKTSTNSASHAASRESIRTRGTRGDPAVNLCFLMALLS
ncbi:hypothetical protein EG68_00687 [Paragonimus skrjabini miyazakii]|uniref:Uncharacterized protein n=1 Tax=Paragonimus skrjabini miyazakii TaxID=59628 RepID=A0A8S9ZC99_9TREM|nr:hypothetical protein EG68_00687 [Paragonimus skrjabini miyazakii]